MRKAGTSYVSSCAKPFLCYLHFFLLLLHMFGINEALPFILFQHQGMLLQQMQLPLGRFLTATLSSDSTSGIGRYLSVKTLTWLVRVFYQSFLKYFCFWRSSNETFYCEHSAYKFQAYILGSVVIRFGSWDLHGAAKLLCLDSKPHLESFLWHSNPMLCLCHMRSS